MCMSELEITAGQRTFSGEKHFVRAYLNLHGKNVRVRLQRLLGKLLIICVCVHVCVCTYVGAYVCTCVCMCVYGCTLWACIY